MMPKHGHGKPTAQPLKLATLTSVNGVLDINSTAYTEGPADYVQVYNALGAYPYDPAVPSFRLDQPTNPSLPHPPSPVIGFVPALNNNRAATTDDLRIYVPVTRGDLSENAPIDTTKIFGATITYFPDDFFLTDEAGNPIVMPKYLVVLS